MSDDAIPVDEARRETPACERCGRFAWEKCNGTGTQYMPCPHADGPPWDMRRHGAQMHPLSPPRQSDVITLAGDHAKPGA